MKANELRIGNIIGDTLLNTVVVTIDVLKTIDDHTSPIGEDGVFKPMPLTEEWLLKFGFARIAFTDYDHECLWGLVFQIDNDLNGDDRCCVIARDLRIKRIGYVHQLQNLYFALTGEELKIK